MDAEQIEYERTNMSEEEHQALEQEENDENSFMSQRGK